MDYIRLFDTETNYNTAKDNFEYPTVSYIEGTDQLVYMLKPYDYSQDYLTFEALESGTFTLTIPANVDSTHMTSVSYSTDNGKTWTTTNNSSSQVTITTPTINAGDKVLWKGVGKQLTYSTWQTYPSKFTATNNFNASGNIMSLLYGDDFNDKTAFPSDSNDNFSNLFQNNDKIISAQHLVVPATTLASGCYDSMFENCTSLTTAPELPATTLVNSCYGDMFKGCTALTTAPELPATTLANYCYTTMFEGCTSLTEAPTLPATTLAQACYGGMFMGCTSLLIAPELPATTLAYQCYYSYRDGVNKGMFRDCTSLTTAPELPATTLTYQCYAHMFSGCTSLTIAPKLPATTLAQGCYYNMFYGTNLLPDCSNIDFTSTTVVASRGLQGLFGGTKITNAELANILPKNGNNKYYLPVTTLSEACYESMFNHCTMLTTAPELPATTLANNCYRTMFWGCTSLTTAPVLPATTLASYCYYYLFKDCTNLNYIKAMFTTTPGSSTNGSWVQNVASTGTFVKNSAASWDVSGDNGIPSGWTVETASE